MAWWNPTTWNVKSAGSSVSGSVFFPTVTEPFGLDTYSVFAFEGYKRNSTAYACVNWISRAISGLPIKVFREVMTASGVEEVMVSDHPVWRLIGNHGRPSPDKSWGQFNDAYWAYRHIDGNNYLFAAGDAENPGALILLRPDLVQLEIDRRGRVPKLVGYNHTTDGIHRLIPAEKILHTRTFNPLSPIGDWLGMPIFEACAAEIDQDNNAGAWNNALLKNGARPSMFINAELDAPKLNPEQRKMLRGWTDANVAGMRNAGKVFLGQGLTVQEVGKSPKDMDWLKGMIQAKVAIANVCGVPPELVGIQNQKTYSNYQEARKAFYEETVIPYADDFFRSLTIFFNSRFKGLAVRPIEPVIIAVDKNNVKALQESQDSLHGRMRDNLQGGLFTTNESRAPLGMDEVDGGDVILVQGNRVPLEDVVVSDDDSETMPSNLPLPVEEEEDEE